MAAGKSSRINRQYKTKYRIRNLSEYERGLRSRGDVTIWLSEDAIAAWIPPKNGLRGGQRRYSNLAIRIALTLRVVFGLPLRQTEGFLDSLLSLMSRDLKAPDHTTLSRRNQIVVVPPLTRAHDGPIDLIVDSTGLKILGRGEWNAHKHKASKKRQDWRKLHIGVDAKGFIVAAELTASSRDDLRGNPEQAAAVADSLEFEHKYTSGVIAWAPEDVPSDAQISRVVDEFEKTAWAGLEPDRYAWSAIEHRRADGGVHVHVLAARVDLETGKSLNIAAPGWQKTFDALRDWQNHENGWSRPDDPARARDVLISTLLGCP